ncbi:MAG: right-handed parallel beta-helix repeat-containing protein, partial [Planctomycetota bacterium]
PAFLDRPGEWYLDRQSGVLIYKPMENETPSEMEAIAPLARQLLLVQKVKNLHFKGLSFKHCSWIFDGGRYASAQACFSHPFPLKIPRDKTERWWLPIPPALLFEFAESCSIEDVTVANLGGSGIWFHRGCNKNEIIGCHIYDIAANGVMIGESDINKVTEKEAAANNIIKNNLIELCGQEYYGAHGVWIGFSRENNVAHNEVRYHPYGAISVGWSWNTNPTPCKKNIIEYNNVHHAMLILSDSGGIYTLGVQPGTILRGNWIHDIPVNAGRSQSNGIFLDCGSTGIVVEENIIQDVVCSPLRFNRATTNTVKNNLLVIKPIVPPHIKYRNTNKKDIEEFKNTIIVLDPEGKNYPRKLIEEKAKKPGLEKDYRKKLSQI